MTEKEPVAESERPRSGAARNGAEGEDEPTGKERRPDEVRVVAVEAAVAAGLLTGTAPSSPRAPEAPISIEPEGSFVLPDWTDPPTGQVPRVLLDEGDDGESTRTRGPSWRQTSADWEADEDTLGFLVEQEEPVAADDAAAIAGRGEDVTADVAPFEFDFSPANRRRRVRRDGTPIGRSEAAERPVGDSEDDAWSQVVGAAQRRRRRAAAHRARASVPSGDVRPAPRRNTAVALATGVVLAGVAVACFEAGPAVALGLAAFVLALAGGETLGALRHAGYRPMAILALAAVPALVIASYLRGPEAVPVVLAVVIVLAGVWRVLFEGDGSPIEDLGSTVLVIVWVGVLGSFAGLLLNPSTFPHRHGVAYLGAAIALTVAHDIGSFFVGARFGRHRIAPRVSPGKTLEGLLGGSALVFIVAGLLVARVHPFSVATALGLAAVVVVLAPLGDLLESVIKRDLGLKDMGRLLPAHGGIADRIDAILFVLPATYLLVRLVHV